MYQLILRKGTTAPHSFFNRIFASATDYKSDLIPEAVLEHEKAHLDQKHSLDVILIELLLIFFWFHPLSYLIRYSVKLNHEFLADQTVLNQGVSTSDYQQTLLDHATSIYQQAMANTFTFPIIKKRFAIMETKTSRSSLLLRSLAFIPVVTLLVISCGKEEKKFEIPDVQYEVNDVEYTETPSNLRSDTRDVVYAQPGEIVTPDIYYKGVEFIVYDNAVTYNDTTIGEQVVKNLYENLTATDKEKIGGFMLSVLHKPHEIRIPSESDMEEYLNSKVFRIWIDGEEVPNNKLDDYAISEFKSHSGRMFITKTARKVLPQAFNVMFYTPDYFESQNMGKQLKYYPGKQMVSYNNVKRVHENYKP